MLVVAVGCGGSVDQASPADAAADDASASVDAAVDDAAEPVSDGGPDASDAKPPVVDAPPSDSGGTPGARPPKRPDTAAAGGAVRWFAVKVVFPGTKTRGGVSSPTAWRDYGFDLDARDTTAADSLAMTNTCKRRAGAGTKVLADGTSGIDNNFGSYVVPIMKSLKSDFEEASNQAIADGSSTLLLRLENVGPADNAHVPGELYLAGALGHAPTFTASDVWPIDGRTVDASKTAKAKFPGGYMAGGVWVSGDVGAVKATMPIAGFFGAAPLLVPMESVVVTFDVAKGTDGTIAGALRGEDLAKAMTPALEKFGICPGTSTFDSVVDTFTSASDLVSGAPLLQDTSRTCDALSLGMGFEVVPTGVPTSIVTPPDAPSDCP